MRSKSKNEKQLQDFVIYCQNNPSERFWQALRNWSGYGFIYGSNEIDFHGSPIDGSNKCQQNLEDTFFIT